MTTYIYKAGNPKLAPILLLHSTGGDEQQLLPIAEMLAPEHPILSIRGRISENGINRYFKLKHQRFTKESFDLESLKIEANWLAKAISRLAVQYGLDENKFIVLGYSNGANVALYMTLTGIFKFDKVIAFHSMQIADLKNSVIAGNSIFLSHAENDPIVLSENFGALVEDLEKAACHIEIFKSNYGHQLTEEEINAAKLWLKK